MIECPPELVGLLVALVILLAWAALANVLFGHPTYFRSRSGKDGGREDQEPAHDFPASSLHPSLRSHAPPAAAPAYAQPPSTPDVLQSLLPQDLFASEILAFLSPYHLTRVLPTCEFIEQAGELPAYWNQAAQRRSWALQWPPDKIYNAGKKKECKVWDLSACKQPKLEFFRRVFIRPYQISSGHHTRKSCRVIVQGKVYDVTSFLSMHPGGDTILLEHAGHVDATAFFEISNHSDTAQKMMRQYLLWDPTPSLGKAGTILALFSHRPPRCFEYSAKHPPGLWTDLRLPRLPSSLRDLVKGKLPPLSLQAMITGEKPKSESVWLVDDRRRLYPRTEMDERSPPSIVKILESKRF